MTTHKTHHQQIQVLDTDTGLVLKSYPMEEAEAAYEFAAECENLGLMVKLEGPSIHQTLLDSLGTPKNERDSYQASLIQEIEEH